MNISKTTTKKKLKTDYMNYLSAFVIKKRNTS